jgi:hypothetical protein
MAEESSPLEHVAAIYAPFDAAEARRLRTYVEDMETITGMAFFANPTRSMRIEGGTVQPVTVKLNDIDDEAVHAVMGLFRSLYVPSEPTSYRSIMKLLKRHLCESQHREACFHALRDLERWEKEVMASSMVRFSLNGTPISTHEIITKFLYAQYSHKDGDKGEWLDTFGVAREALRGEFLRAIYVLVKVYWVGHNVVKPILTTPSLVPAQSPYVGV